MSKSGDTKMQQFKIVARQMNRRVGALLRKYGIYFTAHKNASIY